MFTLDRFKDIRHFVFDVDGVFTDGKFLVGDDGQLLRTMNARDGLAMKIALQQNFTISIITGGNHGGVVQRFSSFGIEEIHTAVHDKLPVLEELLTRKEWDKNHVLYMGDDLPDIPCIRAVGLGTCPADAAEEVQAAADFISPHNGGQACIRDIIERVLKIQNRWPQL